jgi:hypothetical protein
MVIDPKFSTAPEERIPRAEERLCSLQESAAVAMIFIRIAGRKAEAMEAGEEPQGSHDPLEMYVKASRMLSVSVAQQAKVEKELAGLRAGDPLMETTPRRAPSGESHNPEAKPEPDRKFRRDQIHGHVLDLVHPMSYEPVARARIYENLHERLYETERYDLLLDLSTEEAVETICRDLGVRPQYERWEGLDWPPWRIGKPAPDPSAWKSRAEELAGELPTETEHDEAYFSYETPPWPPP